MEFTERGLAGFAISQKYITPLSIVILDGLNAL